MKQYEYERLLYEGVFTSKLEGHREVIDRRARRKTTSFGTTEEFLLLY